MAEIWPARLRSSGMGMSYGIGNLGGKVLGPAGLAVIMGAGEAGRSTCCCCGIGLRR